MRLFSRVCEIWNLTRNQTADILQTASTLSGLFRRKRASNPAALAESSAFCRGILLLSLPGQLFPFY
jgi:hypothetical protein